METAAEGVSPSGAVDLEPLTVLIVDDDVAILAGLTELLESEGYAVATASDGHNALEQLRTGLHPCVILLDLMMPGMDGWDFRSEQMRSPDLRDIPLIVITATGFSEASVRLQFGEIDVVPKPVSVPALLAAVRHQSGETVH